MKLNTFLRLLSVFLCMILLLGMSACAVGGSATKLNPGPGGALTLSDTDYADRHNWLSFGGDADKKVDIFTIYPTVTMSMEDADRPYVRLDSALMHEMAAGWLVDNEGLFSESANIYAPLYRQLNAIELDSLNSDTFASYTNATPREDIFAAFDYYLTHINKGERPFILLGHSQGAQLVIELATTFLGNEHYYTYNKNHIITYSIGCSITAEQIVLNPNLQFSQSKNDTGVLVSWNTTAPSEIASGAYTVFGTWKSGALMTNPITWLTNETLAPAADNKASKIVQPDGTVEMVPAYANAVVDKEHSVLVTTTVEESNYLSMSIKVSKFHPYDIAFYYDSIKQNIKDRIAAFKAA